MNLKIETGKYVRQPGQFGKLIVDTGVKSENSGNILLGESHPPRLNRAPPSPNYAAPGPPIQSAATRRKPNTVIDTTGSSQIKRGQKIGLGQKVSNLSGLIIGLQWDLNAGAREFELDTSIFMVDTADKTEEANFIFYNNPASRCGGVILKADHHTGVKECYDEILQLDLNRIPPYIQTLAVTVTIDEADARGQNFGQVSDAYLKIIDASIRKEVLFYKFAEQLSVETAIVVTEIYRHKSEWKINAIGRGFRGGLAALCDNYGIETE